MRDPSFPPRLAPLTEPPMAAAGRVAVLGAGMTGAVCARTLAKAGMTVTLFEMGRGSGGRMPGGHRGKGHSRATLSH